MPGSHLFNLGLFQKNFNSTSRVTGPAINMGCTRGRGSTTRMLNYCTQRSSNQSECINQFVTVKNNLKTINEENNNICPFLSYVTERGPENGILNRNFGWDSQGIWFSGNAGDNQPSYPIFSKFVIPVNKKVEVCVDFVYNERCSDFGLCFYQDGDIPEWNWGSNNKRIACQYDCPTPCIYGLTNEIRSSYNLVVGNTYTCDVIYNPNNNPNTTLTTKLNGNIVNSISLNDNKLSNDYRIGFCSDRDTSSFKTYIKNLKININNGEQIYENSLQNIIIL